MEEALHHSNCKMYDDQNVNHQNIIINNIEEAALDFYTMLIHLPILFAKVALSAAEPPAPSPDPEISSIVDACNMFPS